MGGVGGLVLWVLFAGTMLAIFAITAGVFAVVSNVKGTQWPAKPWRWLAYLFPYLVIAIAFLILLQSRQDRSQSPMPTVNYSPQTENQN